MDAKSYFRHCPKCNNKIFHNTLKGCAYATKRKRRCKKCALEATREKTQSKEWREQQSLRLKRVWADDASSYHKPEYSENLAQAQKKRWEDASDQEKHEWKSALKLGWERSSPERRKIISKLAKDPILKERRRQSNIKSWAKDEARREKQSKLASLKMKDPAYKERCTRKLIESAVRTGGKSKAEKQIGEFLKQYGFVTSFRIENYYVDFYNPETNMVVEYYGDWWHCHPKHHSRINTIYNGVIPQNGKSISEIIEHDRVRIEKLKSLGYTVKILWENDVKNRKILNTDLVREVLSIKE